MAIGGVSAAKHFLVVFIHDLAAFREKLGQDLTPLTVSEVLMTTLAAKIAHFSPTD